ncbi:MAG TPA: Rrf2 family transcriptional regulator [Pseudogracilibacillus sp.]|nr:Rrf2 family transcriptional regulator [Pseudogracilibacillus sp.]
MKISTKGRYGLTLMIELARNYGAGPLSLKSIAEQKDLSNHYLEQLATPLRNAGLIRSVRGPYGGYTLAKEPDKITSGDIIRVLEGPITLVEVMEEEEAAQQALWMQIRDVIKEVLDTTTLDDLIKYDDEDPQKDYMYYI